MKLHQLSIFVQNEAGSLAKYLRILAEGNVNLHTITLADTRDFGILRLVVSEWERAKDLLEVAGAAVKVTEVYAIAVNDQPGGLASVTDTLLKAGVNIEYMYAYTLRKDNHAIMIFRFDNAAEALKALATEGVTPVDPERLFE